MSRSLWWQTLHLAVTHGTICLCQAHHALLVIELHKHKIIKPRKNMSASSLLGLTTTDAILCNISRPTMAININKIQ